MTSEEFLYKIIADVSNQIAEKPSMQSLSGLLSVFLSFGMFFLLVTSLTMFICQIFDFLMEYLEKKRTRKKYLKEHRFDRFRINALPNDNFLVYEDLDEGGQFPLYVLTNPYNAQDICDILNMDKIGKRYTPKAFKKLSDSLQAEDINNLKTTENGGEKE